VRHAGDLPDFLWKNSQGRLDHRSCGWVCGGCESREARNVRAKELSSCSFAEAAPLIQRRSTGIRAPTWALSQTKRTC
jgi:hypothetical protein